MMKHGLLVVTLLLLLALVWLASGCQKPPQSDQPAAPQSVASVATDHKVTQAEVGQDVVCPVMGTEFKVASDTLAAEYKGKVYYFCCPSCPGPFKANPEKYVHP